MKLKVKFRKLVSIVLVSLILLLQPFQYVLAANSNLQRYPEELLFISPLDNQFIVGDVLNVTLMYSPRKFIFDNREKTFPFKYQEIVLWVNNKIAYSQIINHNAEIQNFDISLESIPEESFSLRATLHTIPASSIFGKLLDKKLISYDRYENIIRRTVVQSSDTITVNRYMNLPLPKNEHMITVGDEENGIQVEVADFTGIANPPFDENRTPLNIVGGPEMAADEVVNGKFSKNLNTKSTALLFATHRAGGEVKISMLAVMPKHPDLLQQNPVIDPFTTAEALLFIQPGLATGDPLIDALFLQIIAELPETSELAYILNEKMAKNADVLSNPDVEIATAFKNANDALLMYFNSLNKDEPMSFLEKIFSKFAMTASAAANKNCDTNNEWFENDINLDNETDNLCMSLINDPAEENTLRFSSTNNSPRWVFHYLDKDIDGQHVMGNNDLPPHAVSLPRRITLPSVQEAVLDVAWSVTLTPIIKKIKGEKITLETFTDSLKDKFASYFSPKTTLFTIQKPTAGEYYLANYGFGGFYADQPSIEIAKLRLLAPNYLTILTELLFPLTSLAIDIQFEISDQINYPDLLEVLYDVLVRHENDLQDLVVKLNKGDTLGALEDTTLLFGKLLIDPYIPLIFAKIIGKQLFDKEIQDFVAFFVNHAISAVFVVNKLIAFGNLSITVISLVDVINDYSFFDRYYLKVEAAEITPTPSPTPSINPLPNPSPTPVFDDYKNWLTVGHDGGQSRYLRSGLELPLTEEWRIGDFYVEREPLILDDLIYIQRGVNIDGVQQGIIEARNRYQGNEVKWTYSMNHDNCVLFMYSGMAIANGKLLVREYGCDGEVEKGYLRALDAKTGDPLWKKDWRVYLKIAWMRMYSPPASANGKFFVDGSNGTVAIDPETGNELATYPTQGYNYRPIVDQHYIYGLLSNDLNTFVAVSLENGITQWSKKNIFARGRFLVSENMIYSYNNNVQVYDKNTGELKWGIDRGDALAASPEMVLISKGDDILYAYDSYSGDEIWSVPVPLGYATTISGARIYRLLNPGHEISVLSLETGGEIDSTPLNLAGGSNSGNTMVVAGNWVYVVDSGRTMVGFQGQD